MKSLLLYLTTHTIYNESNTLETKYIFENCNILRKYLIKIKMKTRLQLNIMKIYNYINANEKKGIVF